MNEYKKFIGCMAVDITGIGKQYFFCDRKTGGVSVKDFDKWDWDFIECDDDVWDELIVGASCLGRW